MYVPAISSRIVEWSSRRIQTRTCVDFQFIRAIERADAEHRRQRGRVDPRRDQLATRIGDCHQHHTCDERDEERVLVEHTPQTRLRRNVHRGSAPTLDDEGR